MKAVENTDKIFHLVIPPKASRELSDDVLDTVTGGFDLGQGHTDHMRCYVAGMPS